MHLQHLKTRYFLIREAYGRIAPFFFLREQFPNATGFDIVLPDKMGRIILTIDQVTGRFREVKLALFRPADELRFRTITSGLEGAKVIAIQYGFGGFGNPDERNPDPNWNGAATSWPDILGIEAENPDGAVPFIPVQHIKSLRLPEFVPANPTLQVYPLIHRLWKLEFLHLAITSNLNGMIKEIGEHCVNLKRLHIGTDISVGFTLVEIGQALYTKWDTSHLPHLVDLAFVLNLNGSFNQQTNGEPKKKNIPANPVRGRNLHIALLINYHSSQVFLTIDTEVFKHFVDESIGLFHHPSVSVQAPFYGSVKFWTKPEVQIKAKRIN